MTLVIIEGIGKKETIEKYLGKGYKVVATGGHIRDLPPKSLAVNVKNNFEPKYVVMEDKADAAERLKKEAAKAGNVLLATDPDREGEAISWHVAHILDIDPNQNIRIEFNEISKKAVTKALENPRPVNLNLVDAQQARRVLDRLVGFKISPVLCKKIQNKLSAGRVQSVTLRLVVEREREIRNFKPEEYWPFFSVLQKEKNPSFIKAVLVKKGSDKLKLTSKEEVDAVLKDIDGKPYIVKTVKKSITKSRPPAPFITSSLQQDALNKLGFSLKQTQAFAQNLYEGVEIPGEGKVALVTYIRTDSTRVAPDAISEAREFITKKFGKDYIPEKPNYYASKKGAQDAHEAIRPISIDRTPEALQNALSNKNHYKLYKLIYERFLASQMSEAQYNSLSVDIDCNNYGFKVTGKTPLFAGYTAIYNMFEEKKEGDDELDSSKLPELNEGDVLDFVKYQFEQKFTKPPARYTEASLVKAMEEKGIGRPATYVPTVATLASREYTSKDGRYIAATELGEKATDMLLKYFPDFFEVAFTAKMEEELDKIEDGGVVWQSVVGGYYSGLEEKISVALDDSFTLKAAPIPTQEVCEKCGKSMVIRQGRYGAFLACPGFPKCKNTKQLESFEGGSAVKATKGDTADDGLTPPPETESFGDFGDAAFTDNTVPVKVVLKEEEKIPCEKCGKDMILRQGKFGPFYGCSGYPACKNIISKEKKEDVKAGICPTCGKDMKAINFRGKTFYGCKGYPDCKFSVNAPVSDEKCSDCGSFTLDKTFKDGKYIVCGAKECKFKKKVAELDAEN